MDGERYESYSVVNRQCKVKKVSLIRKVECVKSDKLRSDEH